MLETLTLSREINEIKLLVAGEPEFSPVTVVCLAFLYICVFLLIRVERKWVVWVSDKEGNSYCIPLKT